jgi:hypothetical protein
MRIGIDFDNTLVDYDCVFLGAAKERGLVDAAFGGSKRAVRDSIRSLPDGEFAWQRLQGYVYGAGIGDAVMFDGVDLFLRDCWARGIEVFVISHKTQFGHHDPMSMILQQRRVRNPRRSRVFREHAVGEARAGARGRLHTFHRRFGRSLR